MIYRELLLGCGYRRERLIDPYEFKAYRETPQGTDDERWKNVVCIDVNPACAPHYVMDIEQGLRTTDYPFPENQIELFNKEVTAQGRISWQLAASQFAEVHAYEVLEHLGQQGDFRTFFQTFDEIWRVLRPGGWLCATVPSRYSPWLWGDPGHRRAILPETLVFLNRPHYDQWLGKGPSSDYRPVFDSDWDIVQSYDNEETHQFILQAVKPARAPEP